MFSMSITTTRRIATHAIVLLGCLFAAAVSNGNPYSPDSSSKPLMAGLEKKGKTEFVIRQPNVVFPDALSGHEEESLSYIEKFSNNRRDYIIRTYNRGKKFFPKVSTIFNRYKVPEELKVLIALESAFNGNAVSKAGAVGYWQIMDEVAREYGMKYVSQADIAAAKKAATVKKGKKGKVAKPKVMLARDDRKNFLRSTSAAARYLRDRGRNLDNDLLLMVASYNCGVGNVWNAMEKSGKSEPDFWDIKDYLPAETRAYVMNFITLNVIFHNYEGFINNSLTFTPVKVKLDETGKEATTTPVKTL
jgi:membrane-bound lytic murein transglycosylase D